MFSVKLSLFIALCLVNKEQAARILVISTIPSMSHQLIIRTIVGELLKRNHEVVVLTTDPAYEKGQAPKNLTEIDVHGLSYSFSRQQLLNDWIKETDRLRIIRSWYKSASNIFEKQFKSEAVQRLIKDKDQHFDLIILDGSFKAVLIWSHLVKAPVIFIHATVAVDCIDYVTGAVTHPTIYQQYSTFKYGDLTMWEKIKVIYLTYMLYRIETQNLERMNELFKRLFGPDTPTLWELQNNVDMSFYSGTPVWASNRPTPPNLVYIGGLHLGPGKPLPQDILTDLDNSPQDIIYVSFGTNINTSDLPPCILQVLCKTFAALPYKVYWKWERNQSYELSTNILTFKWLPQADFLRHPKVKLFITHAGMRSTEEAIDAGVPLIGIPFAMDQLYNAEKYLELGIGLKVNFDTVTEELLTDAVSMIMRNDSYRQNVQRLRARMNDQPMKPLERAVWWTEYVLRHGGSRHLRSPAANMPWTQYLELKLVFTVLLVVVAIVTALVVLICVVFKLIRNRRNKRKMKIF